MKSIVNYLLLFILVSSCTKFGKNVTIKGKVLNPITGEAIPNAEIWLQKTTNGLPGGMKTIKTVTSDSNGDYELNKFSIKALSAICVLGNEYYKIGWKDANTGENMGNPTLNVNKGKKMNVNFYAVPYGNLQINVKNISCFDSNDQLSIFRTHSISNFYDNVQNPAIYNGCIDQIGNMNKAPMGWYKFSGTVTKNNITLPIKDSIYLNSGETKIWNINY